ncbi:MAG: response regulator transcription factor [Proteobacteria bacterium]|jgi:DNA-binding response OmpR family regulator|nr:response regulator transcription factor [Desulfocapsa sp.]MBU3943521.1 response regulator transcription factor [Pseudomonadota bacterium]MCG2743411.1 response regulator transcription factor [Desulfobacteraceae bacterium]MBU4028884.1 response regulator transcription factor [Pseudomonadota bacterium]MBU4044279.1 response regulator transcription factor [Pseudomonadota bacterium]
MYKILIIEDEIKIAHSLKQVLEEEGYSVNAALTGEEGFFLINTDIFDVVILDLMLPGRSGLEILEVLRRRDKQTLVLILTARDTVEDRILGLDCGADDYMIKPFAVSELLARIRVLLRRGRSEQVFRLQFAGLDLDLVTREVHRDGQTLDLTAKEFDLLTYFVRHQGRFVTRGMIARDLWQETTRATPLDNVIDVHMARLRRKVDKDFPEKLLHTIRGVGFILKKKES